MENNVVISDLAYGAHERHRVDIYIPESPVSREGIVLFVHGGGWNQGDKSGHHDDMQYLCNSGYVCASMNYRFVSESISIFDELDDISSALNAIKSRCVDYGCDINKVILSGGSAGGHLSLMYAYTRAGEAPVIPVGACVYCPPVMCWSADFLLGISGEFEEWKYEILSKCCGVKMTSSDFLCEPQQIALKKMSPMECVSGSCVPTAVFHGRKDELVPFEHTLQFLERLTELGVKNELLIYENSGHALDNDPGMRERCRATTRRYAQELF